MSGASKMEQTQSTLSVIRIAAHQIWQCISGFFVTGHVNALTIAYGGVMSFIYNHGVAAAIYCYVDLPRSITYVRVSAWQRSAN